MRLLNRQRPKSGRGGVTQRGESLYVLVVLGVVLRRLQDSEAQYRIPYEGNDPQVVNRQCAGKSYDSAPVAPGNHDLTVRRTLPQCRH